VLDGIYLIDPLKNSPMTRATIACLILLAFAPSGPALATTYVEAANTYDTYYDQANVAYNFTLLAGQNALGTLPGLNGSGQAAFVAEFGTPAAPQQGLFLGSGAVDGSGNRRVTELARTGDVVMLPGPDTAARPYTIASFVNDSNVGQIPVNASGRAAFLATLKDDAGVSAGTALLAAGGVGPLEVVANPLLVGQSGLFSISDAGTVAYTYQELGGLNRLVLATNKDGPLVASGGRGTFAPDLNTGGSINDAGVIAFRGNDPLTGGDNIYTLAPVPDGSGGFTYAGQSPRLAVSSNSDAGAFEAEVLINGAGTIAYRTGGEGQAFTQSAGGAPVLRSGGYSAMNALDGLFRGLGLDGADGVAFQAQLGLTQGIFIDGANPGPVVISGQQIAPANDPLLFLPGGLACANSFADGALAFWAQSGAPPAGQESLYAPRLGEAIFIATAEAPGPAVPEPAALALLAVGALAAAAHRVRR
jgi:hypothetical protein